MRYSEIRENYSPENDKHNSIELDDTRKSRLTLSHLSNLRKVREYKKFQKAEDMKVVQKMYSAPSGEGGEI
jgi:hypothetical protein